MIFRRERRRQEEFERSSIFVENELTDRLKLFPRAHMGPAEYDKNKKKCTFLIDQERGKGEEPLHSLAFIKIVRDPEVAIIYWTKGMDNGIRLPASRVSCAIIDVVAFIEKYNKITVEE